MLIWCDKSFIITIVCVPSKRIPDASSSITIFWPYNTPNVWFLLTVSVEAVIISPIKEIILAKLGTEYEFNIPKANYQYFRLVANSVSGGEIRNCHGYKIQLYGY